MVNTNVLTNRKPGGTPLHKCSKLRQSLRLAQTSPLEPGSTHQLLALSIAAWKQDLPRWPKPAIEGPFKEARCFSNCAQNDSFNNPFPSPNSTVGASGRMLSASFCGKVKFCACLRRGSNPHSFPDSSITIPGLTMHRRDRPSASTEDYWLT